MKTVNRYRIALLCCLGTGLILTSSASGGAAAVPAAVSLVVVDGEMRQDWPDRGVVGFRRNKAASTDLVVNFALSGTAVLDGDYTSSSARSVTIPAGDREAWVEFTPAGQPGGAPGKTIIVTLQPGTGYSLPELASDQTATVALEAASSKPSSKAAVRFLGQAAFGANGDLRNVKEVMAKGYEKWISDQFKRPIGLQQPYFENLRRLKKGKVYSDSKVICWANRAMNNSATADVLRQRVAFALSEIFVISDHLDDLAEHSSGMLNYYDLMLKGAFGNYRSLLYGTATHPCMGVYLNHLQNEKGDPAAGTFADENFAREIMQLFSIGVWELNLDGTRKLNGAGQPIATYDNETIANMARVMTGFSFGGPKAKDFYYPPENFNVPMRMWDEFHDLGPKTLLSGVVLPARTASEPDLGLAGMLDFNAAIDCLFNHPNTAPFISKQLIQKLVISNPSPAYVQRVASKFVDNGSGVRGDMKAVIQAILLDPEARDPAVMASPTSGKLKEPFLRTLNLMRATNARPNNGVFDLRYLDDVHFQQPLSAYSVFNFFKPGYAPAGPISDAGLVAPEFQILNAVTSLNVPNYYLGALQYGFNRWGSDNPNARVQPHLAAEMALVEDVPALMRRLDLVMTGGTLSKEQHEVIREAVERIDPDMWQWKTARVQMAIYLIASSPEFTVLK